MARLGKFEISVVTLQEGDHKEYRRVPLIIYVNQEGLFTCTLTEDQADEFEQVNIYLGSNGRRGSRSGYFSATTKDALLKQISDCYKEMYSRVLVHQCKVLRYKLATNASYGFTTDGHIIPNLGWRVDGTPDMDRHWQGGTISSHAASPHPTGVQLYVKPLHKKVYKYKSGREVTEYSRETRTAHHTGDVKDAEYNWLWLANIVSTVPSREGTVREIEYTEKRAEFFVNLYKTLCQMASVIAKFETPEEMAKLADSGGALKLGM